MTIENWFSRITIAFLLSFPSLAFAIEKETVGWVEKILVYPPKITVQAKLDTGADYSSLNASEIHEFDRDGKRWVKFSLENRYGESRVIEAEVRRTALIRRHSGKPQKRPVIRLGLCLGRHYMEADVNLVDRTNFDFQMLIGRNYLAGNVIIDPASTYTREPECKGAPKR